MPLRTAVVRALHIDPKSRPHKLLRVVVTFVLFSSTMVFFRAYRLMEAVRIFISMLTVHNFESSPMVRSLPVASTPLTLRCWVSMCWSSLPPMSASTSG